MKVTHEVSDQAIFRHRLTALDHGGQTHTGLWVTYQLPATLTIKDVTYVAVTDYWDRTPPFPAPGKIYLVKEAHV